MATSSANQSTPMDGTVQIYEPVPSLREMTSFVVAIELWRTRLQNNFRHSLEIHKLCKGKHEKVVDELPVPGPIKQTIKKCFKRVASRMFYWARYCLEHVFERNRCIMVSLIIPKADLMGCVWRPNGLIDERKSASNMLSDASLSVLIRFKILSKFCMEDEIEKLSMASIPQRFIQTLDIDHYALAYYWVHRMKGDMSEITTESGQSVAAVMIQNPEVDTWSAIEYFWDQLSLAEQTELIPKLLEDKGKRHTLRLLMKMNDVQKRQAVETSCSDIVRHLWTMEAYHEMAAQIFMRYGNVVSDKQFSWMFVDMFQKSLREHSGDMESLIGVWNILPEHFKERFRQGHGLNLIGYHFPSDKHQRRFVNHYEGSFDFLWTVLRSGDEKYRRDAVLRRAYDPMFLYSDFSVIDELFRLCLPKPADMAEFRKRFGNSEYVAMNMLDCLCYYTLGDEYELYKFIARYFPNPKDMMMFRKGIRKHDNADHLGKIFDQAANALKNGEIEPFEV